MTIDLDADLTFNRHEIAAAWQAFVDGRALPGAGPRQLILESWLRCQQYKLDPRGPLAPPGQYTVRAYQRHGSTTRAIGERQTFEVLSVHEPALERQDPAATLAFQMRVGELQRAVSGTLSALDEALERLGRVDERKVRVVELKFFMGLSIEQTAEVLGVSPATVKRDWELARTWLLREMTADGNADA